MYSRSWFCSCLLFNLAFWAEALFLSFYLSLLSTSVDNYSSIFCNFDLVWFTYSSSFVVLRPRLYIFGSSRGGVGLDGGMNSSFTGLKMVLVIIYSNFVFLFDLVDLLSKEPCESESPALPRLLGETVNCKDFDAKGIDSKSLAFNIKEVFSPFSIFFSMVFCLLIYCSLLQGTPSLWLHFLVFAIEEFWLVIIIKLINSL